MQPAPEPFREVLLAIRDQGEDLLTRLSRSDVVSLRSLGHPDEITALFAALVEFAATDGSNGELSTSAVAASQNAGNVLEDISDLAPILDEGIGFASDAVAASCSPSDHIDALQRLSHGCLLAMSRAVEAYIPRRLVDDVSGLPKKLAFERDVDTALRSATDRLVQVVLLDVDGLKTMNDTEGYEAGNRALRGLAEAMGIEARPSNGRAYHLHGDEFALVIEGMTPADVEALLERIAQSAKRVTNDAREASVVFGFGIANSAIDGASRTVLTDTAEDRLHEYKRAHRQGR